jgi:hypothetical protein
MGKTALPAEDPKGRYAVRSDGASATLGYLGDFTRGPAVFTLYRLGADQGRYPNGPVEYLIDVDDGVGPRECGRFTDEPGRPTTWNRAWNGDDWCPWILEQAFALIAD